MLRKLQLAILVIECIVIGILLELDLERITIESYFCVKEYDNEMSFTNDSLKLVGTLYSSKISLLPEWMEKTTLNSRGGNYDAFMELSKRSGVVITSGECMSACAYMLFTTSNSYIDETINEVVFHTAINHVCAGEVNQTVPGVDTTKYLVGKLPGFFHKRLEHLSDYEQLISFTRAEILAEFPNKNASRLQ